MFSATNFAKWFCSLVLVIPGVVEAQPVRRFTTYSVNEGLSQSTIYKVFQDRRGYMWFSADNGLNCFDGWEIKTYNRTPGGRRAQPLGSNLCEDGKGRIWYSDASGVYCCNRYKSGIDRIATPKLSKPLRDLRSVYLDTLERLWLFSRDTGVFYYDTKQGNFGYFPLPAGLSYSDKQPTQTPIVVDEREVWFPGPDGKDVYSFAIWGQQYKRHPFREPVQNLFFQSERFYIATTNHLYLGAYVGDNVQEIALDLPQGRNFRIEHLVRDAYERIWISTADQGLYCYNARTNETKIYRHFANDPFSLPVDRLTDLWIDRSNNLWIGTKGGGVSKTDLKPSFFEVLPNPHQATAASSYDFSARCFWEDEKGSVWFGAQNNGLSIYEPGADKLRTIPLPVETEADVSPCQQVNHIFKDAAGNIWVSHCRGVAIVDADRKKLNPVSLTAAISDKKDLSVLRVIQLKNGEWLAATPRGLVSIRPTGEPGVFRTNMALYVKPDQNTLTDFLETKDGSLWVSSAEDGLLQYEWQADYTLKRKGQFFPEAELYCLYPDSKTGQQLWLSPPSGLLLFNPQEKNNQDLPEPQLNRAAYGILEDRLGHIWLQTDREIIRVDNTRERWYAFSMKDVLGNNEFHPGAFYFGPSGYLYLGGSKGFVRFKPEEPTHQDGRRFMADIAEIRVNGRSLNADSILSGSGLLIFPSNQNDLEVRFAALDFTNPQANKIEYKLDGLTTEPWRPAFQREAHYTNLEGGYYTLRVRACNALGVWSNEQKILIQIRVPIWQEPWFVFMVLALLFIALLGFQRHDYRRQIAAAERRQQLILAERERIAKDMHDEIGGGLSRIALMTELIEPKLAKNRQMQERVQEIARSARKLVQTMNEIVWALNPHNDRLDYLLAYIREQSYQFFEPFESVRFRINFPDEVPESIKLSNQQRRNLYLVAKESLNNALKHADATEVELRMDLDAKALRFEVRDNGKGIPEDGAGLKKGLGLTSMRKRMTEIRGSIRWSKLHPSGTSVAFAIPLPDANGVL